MPVVSRVALICTARLPRRSRTATACRSSFASSGCSAPSAESRARPASYFAALSAHAFTSLSWRAPAVRARATSRSSRCRSARTCWKLRESARAISRVRSPVTSASGTRWRQRFRQAKGNGPSSGCASSRSKTAGELMDFVPDRDRAGDSRVALVPVEGTAAHLLDGNIGAPAQPAP